MQYKVERATQGFQCSNISQTSLENYCSGFRDNTKSLTAVSRFFTTVKINVKIGIVLLLYSVQVPFDNCMVFSYKNDCMVINFNAHVIMFYLPGVRDNFWSNLFTIRIVRDGELGVMILGLEGQIIWARILISYSWMWWAGGSI